MADLSLTAANVKAVSTATKAYYTCGEAIGAGMPVYKKASDSKYYKAVNSSSEAAAAVGVALNTTSAADQPITIATSGSVAYGAILTVGIPYCVSNTAGGICPVADIGSAEYQTIIGIASTTSNLVVDINASGVAIA